MTIAALLKTALSTVASGIVSTRIYPLKLPQHPTYPAIRYQRIDNTAQKGTTDLRDSRWQVDCFAETYAGVQTLATAVKTLEEHNDMGQSPGITQTLVVNELDDYEDDTKTYKVIVDLILKTTGD